MQTSDYSTNFVIRAEYQKKNEYTGELDDDYTTPHLTIVPKIQSEYINGKKAQIDFLKEKSKQLLPEP